MFNRRVAAVFLVVSILSILPGCGGKTPTPQETKPAAQEKVSLREIIWTGSKQDVVPKEVTKKYMSDHPNVKVDITEGSNAVLYPQMVAAKKTDANNPLFHFGYFNVDTTTKGKMDQMWLKIDPKNVPNIQNVYPEFRKPDDEGICWSIGEVLILYNKDKVKEPPTSWKDVWSNPVYKGHVVLWDNLFYTFLPMTARLNGGDEKNIDAAFRVWSENAGQIHSFVTSLDQMKNLFISGDAWIAPFFLGQQMVWAEEGAPIAAAKPKEGVIAVPYYMQVVAGTKPEEKRVCEDIINELLSPENVGRFAELAKVVPTMKGVKLPSALANNWFFSEEAVKNAVQLDWVTIAKSDAEWRDRWAREVKAKLKK